MTSAEIDVLLRSFRSRISEPDAATAARVRSLVDVRSSARAGRPRKRSVAFAFALALVVTGAAIAAVKEAPWWQGGSSPVDPQAVALVARDSLPAHVDVGRARTVLQDGNAALIAVPLNATGYCLIPTLDRRAATNIRCDYQVVNGAQGDDDQASSFARPATSSAPASWIVYGRVTDARARQLDLGVMNLDLANGGFFLAHVPQNQWDTLSGTANQGRILDGEGRTLRSGCVNWGLQPDTQSSQPFPVQLWQNESGPCKPQPSPPLSMQPTLNLTNAKKLATLTLTNDFSIWHTGERLALWQARATDPWGVVCTYVAAASPQPTDTSHGVPSGPAECAAPLAEPPAVEKRLFISVSFATGPAGLLTGRVGADRGVEKVVLRSAAGDAPLSLGSDHFLGQLPSGGTPGQLPPGGPFVLIAYDASGNELGERSLDEIHKQATPK